MQLQAPPPRPHHAADAAAAARRAVAAIGWGGCPIGRWRAGSLRPRESLRPRRVTGKRRRGGAWRPLTAHTPLQIMAAEADGFSPPLSGFNAAGAGERVWTGAQCRPPPHAPYHAGSVLHSSCRPLLGGGETYHRRGRREPCGDTGGLGGHGGFAASANTDLPPDTRRPLMVGSDRGSWKT